MPQQAEVAATHMEYMSTLQLFGGKTPDTCHLVFSTWHIWPHVTCFAGVYRVKYQRVGGPTLYMVHVRTG